MVLCACANDPAPAEPPAASAPIDATADGFSLTRYEALLRGLADCAVTDRGVDRDCADWVALDTLRANNTEPISRLTAALAALGANHIAAESPAIRLHAARLLANAGPSEPGRMGRLAVAAAGETEPLVLAKMLALLAPEARRDDVRAVLLQAANHSDPVVRRQVVEALTARTAAGTEDTLEVAIAMVTDDPSLEVRARGCRRLGDRGDERALPALTSLTGDPAIPAALYESCLAGMIAMWCGPIAPESPSREAYTATLAHLHARPRSKSRPAWKALTALKHAADATLADRAAWLDLGDVRGALGALITDRDADWMARTTAIDVLVDLRTSRAELARLLERLRPEARRHPGRLVVERLEKALD